MIGTHVAEAIGYLDMPPQDLEDEPGRDFEGLTVGDLEVRAQEAAESGGCQSALPSYVEASSNGLRRAVEGPEGQGKPGEVSRKKRKKTQRGNGVSLFRLLSFLSAIAAFGASGVRLPVVGRRARYSGLSRTIS